MSIAQYVTTLLTSDGDANGTLEVASSSLFRVGAKVYLSSYAELDLGSVATNLDTIVKAKTAGGNDITIASVGDSGLGENVTIARVGNDFTIHFEDGVSTVADVEAAIAALTGDDALIAVKTAGTGASVLVAPDDEFAAESLAGRCCNC